MVPQLSYDLNTGSILPFFSLLLLPFLYTEIWQQKKKLFYTINFQSGAHWYKNQASVTMLKSKYIII